MATNAAFQPDHEALSAQSAKLADASLRSRVVLPVMEMLQLKAGGESYSVERLEEGSVVR
jgi:hypothetical protein